MLCYALLALAVAGHTVSAGFGPSCAAPAQACSAVLPPPPPPPGGCLADGAQWMSDTDTECCSGYAFGQFCTCLPDGTATQATCVECCSRTCPASNICGQYSPPPPPSPAPPPPAIVNCGWKTLRTFNSTSSTYKPSTQGAGCTASVTMSTAVRVSTCTTNTAGVVVMGEDDGTSISYGIALTQSTNGCAIVDPTSSFKLPYQVRLTPSAAIHLTGIKVNLCMDAGASWTLTFTASGGATATVTSSACAIGGDVYYDLSDGGLVLATGDYVSIALSSAGAAGTGTTGMAIAIHEFLGTLGA